MKVSCILFHSNIFSIYKTKWIEKCLKSLENQTFTEFDIFELNYGGDGINLVKYFNLNKRSLFFNIKMKNHVEAMNFLLNKIFHEEKYDVCFNVNLDDYYDLNRFQKQIDKVNEGYDIVSSDYTFVSENGGLDTLGNPLGLGKHSLENLFEMNVTPLAHPCVCYSKNFWNKYGPYEPSEIPEEDKKLWIRSFKNGAKMFIVDETLLFYRLHQKQITSHI